MKGVWSLHGSLWWQFLHDEWLGHLPRCHVHDPLVSRWLFDSFRGAAGRVAPWTSSRCLPSFLGASIWHLPTFLGAAGSGRGRLHGIVIFASFPGLKFCLLKILKIINLLYNLKFFLLTLDVRLEYTVVYISPYMMLVLIFIKMKCILK